METKFESKIGKINQSAEKIYTFISDFRNFNAMIPTDKIKNWQANENECRFKVDMIGEMGLQFAEKQPFSLLKIIALDENNPYNFAFWIQLKEVAPYDTRIKLTLKADLNPMLKLVATKPIQSFLDTLVEQFEKFSSY